MSSADSADLHLRKRTLRTRMLAHRAAVDPAARRAASLAAARHVIRELPWHERPRVALSWPMGEELDTRPLLQALHWLGAMPLLPRMARKGEPLAFHAWDPGIELVAHPFGVAEPPPGLPPVLPELVLAPLLAFDRQGRRLGYGAGFYDRTFIAIEAAGGRPLRAGLCFAAQEVPEVPADASDVPLEVIVTEAGVVRISTVADR